MNKTSTNHDSWAEEYQISAALRKALETKEAEDLLESLVETSIAPELPPEALPVEPVTQYF